MLNAWLTRLMNVFFTRDVSPDNHVIVDLQRRGTWIGLALILQSLNEIDHDWYIPYLAPFGSLIPFVLILGSFYAMWMALRPAPQSHRISAQRLHPALWQKIVVLLTLILTLGGAILLGRGIVMCFLPAQYSNDGTSLDTNAAMLLLEGRNPYTDSNMLDIYRNQHFALEPNWTTPLRQGQFADRYDYPSIAEFRSVLDTALKAGETNEFESKVSYPSLSFLTLVPFALFKNYNVLPFYLVSYLVIIAIAWKVARPELRPWVLLLSFANVPMWGSTIGGNLDVFCTLLLVLAWLLRDKRWWSPIVFGLALASKQTAWFLAPFYFVMLWRHYGLKAAIIRCSLSTSILLVTNLPFILWAPHAWISGVLAPMADPMFPMGVGLINLSVTHLIPFLPTSAYTTLEAVAIMGMLYVYWRICRWKPEAVFLLAIIPLFFAWRSLPSYFYCAAFPIFTIISAKRTPLLPQEAMESEVARHRPAQSKVRIAPSFNAPASI